MQVCVYTKIATVSLQEFLQVTVYTCGRNKNFASGRLRKILQVCVYNIFGRFLPVRKLGRNMHIYPRSCAFFHL